MRVDYDALASRYDRHRRGGGPFLPTLVRLAEQAQAHSVLELGAGTGNNSEAFRAAWPCRLIGLDASGAMLREAQRKKPTGWWIRAEASAIPLQSESVSFIFAVCVLHHLHNLTGVFRECRRVLQPGGIAAFVTSPHDFIERHPMNRYFPSFATIDKSRFQDVPEILQAFQAAGFSAYGAHHDTDTPCPIDRVYYERVAGRFISTYDLIPDAEFQRGLEQFRAEIEACGALRDTIAWECVTVWARKMKA